MTDEQHAAEAQAYFDALDYGAPWSRSTVTPPDAPPVLPCVRVHRKTWWQRALWWLL